MRTYQFPYLRLVITLVFTEPGCLRMLEKKISVFYFIRKISFILLVQQKNKKTYLFSKNVII